MSVQVVEQPVDRVLWRWQVSIATSLLIGYTGYYLCRSNLAVSAPLIIGDGIVDRRAIGTISSAGVLSYALGKLVTGFLGDLVGGRTMFLAGLFGSVIATMLFGLGSTVGWFTAIWVINRFFQSAGWGGLVNIASHWFPAYSLLAGAMALELGGRQGSATAAGLIDTAGYLGAALSGYAVGRLVDAGGWSAAFQALAIVAGASAIAATVYWYRQHSERSVVY